MINVCRDISTKRVPSDLLEALNRVIKASLNGWYTMAPIKKGKKEKFY